MAETFVSERNLEFMLSDVFDLESLTKIPHFEDHDREEFRMVLDTALKMGREMLKPLDREMDRLGVRYEDGTVIVHPAMRKIMREFGESGWIGSILPYEFGGQQLPLTLFVASSFVFNAANFSASVYPALNSGCIHLLISFADEELRDRYTPRLLSGEWQGTMAMTEPQAGSSVSDIQTTATPTDQDFYRIKGQKVFISAGDHDQADNVVHLMLAKIPGGPPGVKGLSLFLVPKHRIANGGSLEPNDVITAGIFHKMGYRGCPLTHLSFGENDDCRGWLVGEPHKGLRYMFQMMNEARVQVGVQATGIASAAYRASLEYARERPQGRNITSKDSTTPQIPIIEHADVKRMLLFQRAVVEGSLSLLLQCSYYDDLVRGAEGEERERLELLLEILTPVAKTFPSEMGILSSSAAIQVAGGYGYCDDYPMEQHYRDIRIHPIHEGTSGIQAMDLLGRKVVMKNGRAYSFFLEELRTTAAEAKRTDLVEYAGRLEDAITSLDDVTKSLIGRAMEGRIEPFLADATLYLELFGLTVVAWQWLKQGLAADRGLAGGATSSDEQFYSGKIATLKYFFHYELPRIGRLSKRLLEDDGLTVELAPDLFDA